MRLGFFIHVGSIEVVSDPCLGAHV